MDITFYPEGDNNTVVSWQDIHPRNIAMPWVLARFVTRSTIGHIPPANQTKSGIYVV